MPGTREFDLVLFGATGFAGKLTAEYLTHAAPPGARIALAGRNKVKLAATRAELGDIADNWALVVADSGNQAELDTMAARTKVVVTTVGPFLRYGMGLATACAKSGTHYADLTGEPHFIKACIDQLDATAAATGAKIVNSCGFDSVPSDLSAYLIYRRTLEDNTGELEATTLVANIKGGMSGGTIDSGRAMFEAIAADPRQAKVLSDPYSLSPDRALEPDLGRQSDVTVRRASEIDPSLSGWVTTFVMGAHNGKIVRRSNALLGWAYGKHFRYTEVMGVGKSPLAPVFAAGITGALVTSTVVGTALSRTGAGRRVLDFVLPKPGTGPDAESRDSGYYTMRTFAHTSSGAKYRATFAAAADPGYKGTAVLLGECGLALAFDKLPPLVGVLTPATGIGDTLVGRLTNAGLSIAVDRLPS